MNKPETLSFTFQERYLSRAFIQSRQHLILYLKLLSKRHGIRADKILFHHDFNDDKDNGQFRDNFKFKGSFDYIKQEVLK